MKLSRAEDHGDVFTKKATKASKRGPHPGQEGEAQPDEEVAEEVEAEAVAHHLAKRHLAGPVDEGGRDLPRTPGTTD